MKKLSLLLVFVGAAACVTEGNYATKLAKTSCDRSQECYRAQFDDDYSSVGDCVDDRSENYDKVATCYQDAGCDFDSKAAADCRSGISNAACEDFEDGDVNNDSCDDIYDCSTSQEVEVLRCIIGA